MSIHAPANDYNEYLEQSWELPHAGFASADQYEQRVNQGVAALRRLLSGEDAITEDSLYDAVGGLPAAWFALEPFFSRVQELRFDLGELAEETEPAGDDDMRTELEQRRARLAAELERATAEAARHVERLTALAGEDIAQLRETEAGQRAEQERAADERMVVRRAVQAQAETGHSIAALNILEKKLTALEQANGKRKVEAAAAELAAALAKNRQALERRYGPEETARIAAAVEAVLTAYKTRQEEVRATLRGVLKGLLDSPQQ